MVDKNMTDENKIKFIQELGSPVLVRSGDVLIIGLPPGTTDEQQESLNEALSDIAPELEGVMVPMSAFAVYRPDDVAEAEKPQKRDERSVMVAARGNNSTELEEDALAQARGFFIEWGAEGGPVLNVRLAADPDYTAFHRPVSQVGDKGWGAEVTVRVVGPADQAPNIHDTEPVEVYGGLKVYRTDDGLYVAADQGGWIPGVYFAPVVARDAWRALNMSRLEDLWKSCEGVITAEDVAKIAPVEEEA